MATIRKFEELEIWQLAKENYEKISLYLIKCERIKISDLQNN
jgi:hypothetical protein